MANVLLVEPDIQLAEIIQKYFENRHNIIVCNNAQNAITLADTHQPELVILELAIPEHNGVEFLNEFRSYTDWTKVPVIIYSQIPIEDTGLSKPEWAKLNITEYLYKSTNSLKNLSGAVEQVL